MHHVAVDLGSKQSQFCIRDSAGNIQKEGKAKTKELKKFFELTVPEKSTVILESCAESFSVADAAAAYGHEAVVVPSTLAGSLGVGQHGIKTDKRDARALSEASCRIKLKGVHIPSQGSREAKALLNARQTLVETRTKLVNAVRGSMRVKILTPGKGTTGTFPKRAKAMLEGEDATLLKAMEPLLKTIEETTKHIAELDALIKQRVEKDTVVQNLMTCPGVGPITALGFRAVIDDVSRFKEAHAVQSYLGLTPGEDSSSQRQRRTSITKAGSGSMRRVLVQAAWCNLKKPKKGKAPEELSDMQEWATKVAERRGRPKAAVALARKMAGILFAMWRDNTPYEKHMKKKEEVEAAND
jgi:transposase